MRKFHKYPSTAAGREREKGGRRDLISLPRFQSVGGRWLTGANFLSSGNTIKSKGGRGNNARHCCQWDGDERWHDSQGLGPMKINVALAEMISATYYALVRASLRSWDRQPALIIRIDVAGRSLTKSSFEKRCTKTLYFWLIQIVRHFIAVKSKSRKIHFVMINDELFGIFTRILRLGYDWENNSNAKY